MMLCNVDGEQRPHSCLETDLVDEVVELADKVWPGVPIVSRRVY
jgi:hypothetical protein